MPTPRAEASLRRGVRRAEPMVWLSAGALALAALLLLALLALLAQRGLAHFWPHPLLLFHLPEQRVGQRVEQGAEQGAGHKAEQRLAQQAERSGAQTGAESDAQGVEFQLGVVLERQRPARGAGARLLVHRGGEDFFASPLLWLREDRLSATSRPAAALALLCRDAGVLFGFLDAIRDERGAASMRGVSAREQVKRLRRLRDRALAAEAPGARAAFRYRLRLASGRALDLPAADILDVSAPNSLSGAGKIRYFLARLWRFVSAAPNHANTQGGVFPAIVGTVTLVFLMTVIVAPLGVLTAIYLQEYAQRGMLTRLVRVAVNNLAGVPSIVYGVFGLGFFVYAVGGSIDRVFFHDALPAPTLGTPGMLWAALTMALLTLPVVIVATEEGLARVPASLREGSLALGATRAETLWRVVLPAASPALLTGLILAVARAAGEVAPLLLVGVAKYAPGLPIDAEFPYLHLDRQFMHLGFSIYDIGFQSPHLAAAEGLVFAAAGLLVLIVLLLNVAAVMLRARLRRAFMPREWI